MGQAIMSLIGAAVGAAVGSAGGIYGGMLIERFRRREAYRLKIYEQMVISVSEIYSTLDSLSYSFLVVTKYPDNSSHFNNLIEDTQKCLFTLTSHLPFVPKQLYDVLDTLTEEIHKFLIAEPSLETIELYSITVKPLIHVSIETARTVVGTTDLLEDFPDVIRTKKQKTKHLEFEQEVKAVLSKDKQEQENQTKEG